MITLNLRFKKKLEEVFFITPNNLGIDFLTDIYKRITAPIKIMPFIFILPLSLFIALILYMILRVSAIRLTNLLQHGF